MTYLEPTHADAFVDYPEREQPKDRPSYVKCPQCKGHGGWNLLLNAYPLHGKEDTPQNRHLFSHFRASCSQCWGWGWLPEAETVCIHDYERGANVGNCLNEWVCSKCKKTVTVDSSD